MANNIKNIIDKAGNVVYPKTISDAIQMTGDNEGMTLNEVITNIKSGESSGVTTNSSLFITPKETNDDVQAAVNLAITKGVNRVVLENKNYILNDTLLIPSKFQLEGIKGLSTLTLTNVDKPVIANTGEIAGNIKLKDFVIIGNQSNINNDGIKINDFNSTISGIEIKNCGGKGINWHTDNVSFNLSENSIEDVIVKQCVGDSFYLGGTAANKVTDSIVRNCVSKGNKTNKALFIGGASGWQIDGLRVFNHEFCNGVIDLEFVNNTFLGNIYLEGFKGNGIVCNEVQKNLTINNISANINTPLVSVDDDTIDEEIVQNVFYFSKDPAIEHTVTAVVSNIQVNCECSYDTNFSYIFDARTYQPQTDEHSKDKLIDVIYLKASNVNIGGLHGESTTLNSGTLDNNFELAEFDPRLDLTLQIYDELATNSKTIIGAINELRNLIVSNKDTSTSGGSAVEEGGSSEGSGGTEEGGSSEGSGGTNSGTADNGLTITYTYTNSVRGNADGILELKSSNTNNDGNYAIYWANNNGKLENYGRITTLTVKGTTTAKHDFLSLNAIPEDATKIIAAIDGTSTAKAEVTIDSNKLINTTKKFCFGALSDIHLDGDGSDESSSAKDFDNEIKYFKSQNAAAICSSGDITCDGRESDVNLVINKKNNAGISIYTVRGNHDCKNYCESKTNWAKVEPNGLIYSKTINDEVFIFMSLYKYEYNYENVFSTDQLSQLKSLLKANKDKRVFLFEHCFVGNVGNVNNIYGEYGGRTLKDTGTAGEFKKLVAKYRNVVLFTGHSHLEFSLQSYNEFANIKQRTAAWCHRVHCPSASKPRKKGGTTNNGGAYGYLVDVYDDFILLKGRDFVNNKNLAYATYILDTKPITIN